MLGPTFKEVTVQSWRQMHKWSIRLQTGSVEGQLSREQSVGLLICLVCQWELCRRGDRDLEKEVKDWGQAFQKVGIPVKDGR